MTNFSQEFRIPVFQSGENGPFVVAIHTSFALLQVTFFFLLVGMRSWRFLFLSLVCGGLWAGITWLIKEIAMMKKVELEAERLRRLRIEREKVQNGDQNSSSLTKEVQDMREDNSWGGEDEEGKKDK